MSGWHMDHLIWADYLMISIVALSAMIGMVRGLLREMFAIFTWVAALWMASHFHTLVSPQLESLITLASIRQIVAFSIIFLLVLLAGSILAFILVRLVQSTGLTGSDRLAGLVFGMVRGVLLVAVVLLLVAQTPLMHDPWWKQSVCIPYFAPLIHWLKSMLPSAFNSYLIFP